MHENAGKALFAFLVSTALLYIPTVSAVAPDPGARGGPFWEMAATVVTPKVTGTAIEHVDERTIRLHDSAPAGWSVEFVADEGFQPFGIHASDNKTGRISAVVSGPRGSCATDGESSVRAQLQIASLDAPAPQGFGTIAGECIGAAAPGISLAASFIVAPSH